MEAKSLQLGNYIFSKTKLHIVRVVSGLYNNNPDNPVAPFIMVLDDDKTMFVDKEENFEPIKVDFDFLEKNGWHKLPHEEIKYYPGISDQFKNDDYVDTMRINYRESMHTYTILNDELRFSTVDEFQRILNVIGLPEEDKEIKF